jgi:hypothetical protein
MNCLQCKQEMSNRKGKKFCKDGCRASFNTELKRLKIKRNKQIEFYNMVSKLKQEEIDIINLMNRKK